MGRQGLSHRQPKEIRTGMNRKFHDFELVGPTAWEDRDWAEKMYI